MKISEIQATEKLQYTVKQISTVMQIYLGIAIHTHKNKTDGISN